MWFEKMETERRQNVRLSLKWNRPTYKVQTEETEIKQGQKFKYLEIVTLKSVGALKQKKFLPKVKVFQKGKCLSKEKKELMSRPPL